MERFETLYEENYPVVYSFLLSLTRNHEQAEDLTQETFLKALKGIKKYKGNCKITTWLIQIAKNSYFTFYKKNQNRLQKEELEQMEAIVGTGVEAEVLEKERVKRIQKVIQALEEPYREVLILHIYGELSFLEISRIYEKSESWARVVFYRAKNKIKENLMEERYV